MAKAYTETTLMSREEQIPSIYHGFVCLKIVEGVRRRCIIGFGLSAYPSQCGETVDVTLNHFYTLVAGIAPITVHYKSNMVRDGASFEYAKEDTSDAIDSIVAKPECVSQKRHYLEATDWACAAAASLHGCRGVETDGLLHPVLVALLAS
jgi:hypothetical protein